MKIFTLFLILAITSLQAQSNEYSEKHLKAIHNLKTAENFEEKYSALIKAERLYSKEIDELIVGYLDDKTTTGSVSPESKFTVMVDNIDLTAMTAFEAKYPEANINYRKNLFGLIKEVRKLTDISDEERKVKFNQAREKAFEITQTKIRTWWEENKDNIEYYGDNQYRIVGQDTQKSQPTQTTQTTETPINPSLLADNTTPNAQPANQATQEAKTQQITAEPTQNKTSNWIIYVLAAVVLLIILIVLKLKKTK